MARAKSVEGPDVVVESVVEETKPMALEDKMDMLMDEVNALKEQLAALFEDDDEGDEEEDKTPYMTCPKCQGRLMQFHDRGWMHESGLVDHSELVVHCMGCHWIGGPQDLVPLREFSV
jgi:hypothetical protein